MPRGEEMSEGGRRLTRSEMRERGLLKPLEEGEASPVEELRRTRDIPVVQATRRRAILAERAEAIEAAGAAEVSEPVERAEAAVPLLEDEGAPTQAYEPVNAAEPRAIHEESAPAGERISVFDRFEADTEASIGEEDHSLMPSFATSASAAAAAPASQVASESVSASEPALEPEVAAEFSEGGSLRERLLARTQSDALRASVTEQEPAPAAAENTGNDAAAPFSPASVPAAQPDPLAHEYVDEDELEDESSPRRWTMTMLLLIVISVVLGLVIGFFFLQHGAQAAPGDLVASSITPNIKEIL
ncbi:hypothetical protein [Actinotignum sp. GS-2025b]|uniref:hypothetical protein n=2 Tax=Actinotignum sp. GS-2025b TaxID=3427275 RepID=UPI003F4543F2